MLCEMQSVSSRIWTRVAVSIFYDDNHYTTGTSTIVNVIAQLDFELANCNAASQHDCHNATVILSKRDQQKKKSTNI